MIRHYILKVSKKAFSRVPHHSLIWKLEYKGDIQGKQLQWMEDFQRERNM